MNPRSPLVFRTLLGSLRQNSLNAAIARALPMLAPAGVEIGDLGPVGDFPLFNEDTRPEDFPPAVSAMAENIRVADGIIIITPEYNYSVPGGLKNAIDWLSRVDRQPFAGKPVAIQTASPGAIGGARAQYHLRQILVCLDAVVLNKPEVIIGQVAGKVTGSPPELCDRETSAFITRQLSALAKLATQTRQ